MNRTLRTAVVMALLGPVLLLVSPASASGRDGIQTEPSVGLSGALVLYVLLPLAVLVVGALLVLLPGWARSDRYRPARGWQAAPVWFNGPTDPEAAVAAAVVGDVTRGGAGGHW